MTSKHLLLARHGPVIGLVGYETGMGQQLQDLKSWNILVQKAQHCGEPDQLGATVSLLDLLGTGSPGDRLLGFTIMSLSPLLTPRVTEGHVSQLLSCEPVSSPD